MPSDSVQSKIDAEKNEPGPASPALCAALGINPEDLHVLPASSPDLPLRHGRVPLAVRPATNPARQAETLAEAAMAHAESEVVKTKESVLTVLATYLSNKPESWWETVTYSRRESEAFFVAKALVHTYELLEK